MTLRKPQKEALDVTMKSIFNKKHKGGLVVIAPGVGKTTYSGKVIEQFIKISKKIKLRILYVIDRNNTVDQTMRTYIPMLGEENVMKYEGGKYPNVKVLCSTIQRLRANSVHYKKKHFDLILIDEAHKVKSLSYIRMLEENQPKYTLGFTATPNRNDMQDIRPVFDNNVLYKFTIQEGVKRNYLSKINYTVYKDNVDYSKIKLNGSRYKASALNKSIISFSKQESYSIRILHEQKTC
jgi:superfamily II DNA or RNA helicase